MSLTKVIAGQQKKEKKQKTHAQKVHFWQEISLGLGYHVNMTFSRTMYIFRIFSLYHLGFDTQRRILLNKNQNYKIVS